MYVINLYHNFLPFKSNTKKKLLLSCVCVCVVMKEMGNNKNLKNGVKMAEKI